MNPPTIHARAYAKINWDLRILGKRADNFHELDSIFVNIGLSDKMRFDSAPELTLSCSDPSLPVDASNLVVKAAELLRKTSGCALGATMRLDKHIPMGGGLGGGSSDAACTLEALNRLWNLNWSIAQLADVGAQVGSDVAYFLTGGWCLCRGRGEIVERLEGPQAWAPLRVLLILPPLHVATPLVYRALRYPAWDGQGGRDCAGVAEALKRSLQIPQGPIQPLHLRNDLTEPALKVEPRLEKIQHVLQRFFPDRWLMSGSGASHFAVPQQETHFADLDALTQQLREAVPATRVIETETRGRGAELSH